MTPESQYEAMMRYRDQARLDDLARAEQVGELAPVTPIRPGVPAPKPQTTSEQIRATTLNYGRGGLARGSRLAIR